MNHRRNCTLHRPTWHSNVLKVIYWKVWLWDIQFHFTYHREEGLLGSDCHLISWKNCFIKNLHPQSEEKVKLLANLNKPQQGSSIKWIATQCTCTWMQHRGVSLLSDCISMPPHPPSLLVTVSTQVLARLPFCDNNHPCQQDTGEGRGCRRYTRHLHRSQLNSKRVPGPDDYGSL